MRLVICIDPGQGGAITKGKLYKVIKSFTGIAGTRFTTIVNDFGMLQDFYERRLKECEDVSPVVLKIREIKSRREKLGYKY